ncbi:hypothetical protein ACUIJN_20315 [Metabacillus halosaccharovorans]|uniref:hypothetical protein n=1 Tax=Metabacillus halosaccharovorans TaxID=930124 RepID=UPI00403DA911
MENYQMLSTDFWKKYKSEGISQEEKYFYQYLLTNPKTKTLESIKLQKRKLLLENRGTVPLYVLRFKNKIYRNPKKSSQPGAAILPQSLLLSEALHFFLPLANSLHVRSPDDAPDGKYVDPLADNDVSESHINDSEPISETEPVDPQTATGNDWVTLSQGEKFTIVSEILAAMTRSGEVTVNADENWFIDALDA